MRALHTAWPANLPVIAARRRRRARSGRRLDMRRAWRQARRDGGELTRLRWTARPPRARRLLLLLDVSGSLKRHTPDLVRLAYTARQAAPARTEVFTFGTRLTRITTALSSSHVDPALAVVSRAVTDADGGTAIGAALRGFLANPRYLALAPGALVVVISDGLERGDPTAMVHATERLSRLAHRLVWWSPLACSPTYRPVTGGMAGVLRHLDHLGGVRDLATGLSEVERLPAVTAGPRRAAHLKGVPMTDLVDAHHHIWRRADLPWLNGEMVPRIFGPYEPIRRDYPAAEYIAEATACGVTSSVYIQTNWPLSQSEDEIRWLAGVHAETGWPTAVIGSADLFAADAPLVMARQAAITPLLRGVRLQLHRHERPEFRFASTPDRMHDSVFRRNIGALAHLGWLLELQVFPSQLGDAAAFVAAFPDITFVLVHAGMLDSREPSRVDEWTRGPRWCPRGSGRCVRTRWRPRRTSSTAPPAASTAWARAQLTDLVVGRYACRGW